MYPEEFSNCSTFVYSYISPLPREKALLAGKPIFGIISSETSALESEGLRDWAKMLTRGNGTRR